MIITILICSLISIHSLPAYGADNKPEVKIEAEGSVDYDLSTNLTTATKNVKLIDNTISIEAQEIVYDASSYSAKASGKVKLSNGDLVLETEELFYNSATGMVEINQPLTISNKQAVYHTNSLVYNLKEQQGTMPSFDSVIKGDSRDYRIIGEKLTFEGDTKVVNKAKFTRCPLPNPDYVLSAKKVIIDDQKIRLERVVLWIKWVPVFYYPSMTFRSDNKQIPTIEADFDNEEGLQIKYDYFSPVTNHLSWRYKGVFSTRGTSDLGFGMSLDYEKLSNDLDFSYDFDGFWKVDDRISFKTGLAKVSFDWHQEFSAEDLTELGLNISSQPWRTPVGQWQLELLARRVSAYDNDDQKYGGTYGGTRLNYNPSDYWSLSYLWLHSFKGDDYRDFLEDYQIGNNYLYSINLPINQSHTFGIEGTFNTTESDWVRRDFRIKSSFDCFKTMIGWNDVEKEFEFRFNIQF